MATVKCFYLDEPLSTDDESFVLDALESRQAIKDRSIATLDYRRVPSVFPVSAPGENSSPDIAHITERLRKHLRNAGIEATETQPLWLMPKETRWGVLFQMAFYEETGFFPYVVQRWKLGEDGTLERGAIRLIDGHGMMGFKNTNG